MQPYINPAYFMYNNPYIHQNQSVQAALNGRVVPTIDHITVNDIPMDGNIAVFPLQDLSEIVVKNWDATGKITTRHFKEVLEIQPTILPSEDMKIEYGANGELAEVFSKRFDELTAKIDKLEETFSKTRKVKKEIETE